MTTPLATDRITITHGTVAVRLVPSLRAAVTLQRKHGLARLANAIASQHVSTILDIVDAATDHDPAGRKIIQQTLADHGVIGLVAHTCALESFIAASFGLDGEPANDQRPTGKHVPIEDALLDLYEIGSGWLGWSPADTWNATPAEIVAAQRGLIAKVQAIHGSGEQKDDSASYDPREEIPLAQVKAGLASLRANIRRGA